MPALATLLPAALAGLLVFLVFWILMARRSARRTPVGPILPSALRQAKQDQIKLATGPSERMDISARLGRTAAVAGMYRRLERSGFGARLAEDLASADLRWRPGEFVALVAGLSIGLPVLIGLTGSLLPGSNGMLLVLGAAALGFLGPQLWLRQRQRRRLAAFNSGLAGTITLLANALRSGVSFLQAVEIVVREGQPPITTEFRRVLREVNLGLDLLVALENLVRRIHSADLVLLTTAISIQYSVGGNLAEILDTIAFTIRERVRIQGEIRAMTAQQRLSGYVVAALPVVILAFIMTTNPGFLAPLLDTTVSVGGLPIGILVFGLGVVMMIVGFIATRRIVKIEV
jgi:tight adherence protein B